MELGQRCVRVQAHSANIVQAAAVALAPLETLDTDSISDLSWSEQRRLLEESYQAEAAPENVRHHSSCYHRTVGGVHNMHVAYIPLSCTGDAIPAC